jgi:hypothetical protein
MENAVYRTQLASDIVHDGMGVELLEDDRIVAEVFRCDADKTVTVTMTAPVPFREMERLLAEARTRLDPFEDGTPLADARCPTSRCN